LDNGVRLVVDHFDSPLAAVVVSVGVGSLFEPRGARGVTHLLEHLSFRVPGFDVDMAVESLGGSCNAYTHRDFVAFVFEGLGDSAVGLVELAHRIYANKRYEAADFERERDVVLSELRMSREDPSERVGDLVVKALFGDSDWGAPVGGTPETVGSLSLGDVVEHKEKWFTPDNTVVVLSGGFSDEAVEKAASLFGSLEGAAPRRGDPSEGVGPGFVEEVGEVDGVYYARAVRLAVDSPPAAYALLHGAAFHLEAGTKSILFNVVRDRGVAYSFYVDFDVVGQVAYLAVVVESARSLGDARAAVAEALRPREPPGYRMRFYDYLISTTLRSPAGRALALAEYMAKGGRPEAMEEELRRAAERGTAWMPPYVVREAEAVVHG